MTRKLNLTTLALAWGLAACELQTEDSANANARAEGLVQSYLKVQSEAEETVAAAALRAAGEDVVQHISSELAATPTSNFLKRRNLTYAVSAIDTSSATDILFHVASRPMPKRDLAAAHKTHEGDPAVQEELVVRMLAIDGLKQQIARGKPAAAAKLRSLVEQGPPELRKHAAIMYLHAMRKSGAAVAVVKAALPQSEHWIVNVRAMTRADRRAPDTSVRPTIRTDRGALETLPAAAPGTLPVTGN